MKELVLVAVLAAVASSALTLLGANALQGEPKPTHANLFPAPQPDLSRVERELAALRIELTEILRSPPAQAGGPRPASREEGPGTPRPAIESGHPAPGEDGPPPLSVPVPTRQKRLAAAIDTDPGSKRHGGVREGLGDRWMLRGEREVLAWYGPPDNIYVQDDGSEKWEFDIPEESRAGGKRYLIVYVHDGRVVGFH